MGSADRLAKVGSVAAQDLPARPEARRQAIEVDADRSRPAQTPFARSIANDADLVADAGDAFSIVAAVAAGKTQTRPVLGHRHDAARRPAAVEAHLEHCGNAIERHGRRGEDAEVVVSEGKIADAEALQLQGVLGVAALAVDPAQRDGAGSRHRRAAAVPGSAHTRSGPVRAGRGRRYPRAPQDLRSRDRCPWPAASGKDEAGRPRPGCRSARCRPRTAPSPPHSPRPCRPWRGEPQGRGSRADIGRGTWRASWSASPPAPRRQLRQCRYHRHQASCA